MSAIPALVKAALAVNIRQPASILFGLVLPIVIIFIFIIVGGGLSDASIANQIVLGILAYSVTNAALSASALTFTGWQSSGLLSRLRLEPISAITLITSYFIMSVVFTIIQATVFVALGVVFLGINFNVQFLTIVLPYILLAGLGFFAIGGIIGILVKSVQAVSTGLNLILLPLAFISGCFIPITALPESLQTVMQFTPLAAFTKVLIDAGNAIGIDGFIATGVILITALIGCIAFAWLYRRRIVI